MHGVVDVHFIVFGLSMRELPFTCVHYIGCLSPVFYLWDVDGSHASLLYGLSPVIGSSISFFMPSHGGMSLGLIWQPFV